MIDLHCHILPAFDDGARSMQETLQMLHAARSAGITRIISTSHYAPEKLEKWQKLVQEITPLAAENGIEFSGSFEYDFSRLPDGHCNLPPLVPPVNETRYLLMDFFQPVSPELVKRKLQQLINDNIKFIIAHPERLFTVQEVEKLQSGMERNIFFQLNAGSITGRYGKFAKKNVRDLILGNYCSFLASDAHRPGHYQSCIEAQKWVLKYCGKEACHFWFEGNQKALLQGKTPTPVPVNISWIKRLFW